jgi:hypothetical protein
MIFDTSSPSLRAQTVCEVALRLAPAFRDKFDFSQRSSRPGDPSHFELLADISFQAAEAFVEKIDQVTIEAEAEQEILDKKQEKEAAHA